MQEAVYPLTLFDSMAAGIVISVGWLVEGSVDVKRLEIALDNITLKWQLLAGRLGKKNGIYQVRIPLDRCPPDHKRFALTSEVSSRPLSDFVSLPFGLSHNLVPPTLFQDAKTPRVVERWCKDDNVPLTYWHVTHFPGPIPSSSHSCIGLTFPHVVFDGVGISAVIHAVEAELLGNDWKVPEAPNPGPCDSLIITTLEDARLSHPDVGNKTDYISAGLVGLWWIVVFTAWSHWRAFRDNSREMMLIIPPGAVNNLVQDTQMKLAYTTGDINKPPSKGDIFTAFIFKTMFSDEKMHPDTTLHLGSFASLRRFFDGALAQYPHNCVIPLPYRPYTARELRHTSIADLAHELSLVRQSFSVDQVLRCYNIMLEGAASKRAFIFFDPTVDESVVMTNITIANVANINWTGAGAGRTLCRYKTSFRKPPLKVLTNMITIVGYRDDGSLLLQLHISRNKFERLKEAVQKLLDQVEK